MGIIVGFWFFRSRLDNDYSNYIDARAQVHLNTHVRDSMRSLNVYAFRVYAHPFSIRESCEFTDNKFDCDRSNDSCFWRRISILIKIRTDVN